MTLPYFNILLFYFLFIFQINAQQEGDTWVIGYFSGGSPDFSVMHLKFANSNLKIEWHFDEMMSLTETAANICDAGGNAIIWTNGMQVYGRGGDTIIHQIAYDPDPEGYWNYWYSSDLGAVGFPFHDGALILPVPLHQDEYSIIYHFAIPHPTLGFQVSKYLEARVRMNGNGTFTELSKDVLIEPEHPGLTATINACRHANGRDWWILTFEDDSPHYYAYILDPDGIHLDHVGDLGSVVKYGLGKPAFSILGNYFARMDATTLEEGQFISLFTFDRCTGNLDLTNTFHTEAGYFTGVAFSPNERYLYADDNTHLWQWDLWESDIASSQTLVDTFDGFIEPGWFATSFAPMNLAPDGRIYIAPSSGGSKRFHVIDRPDLSSPDCRFLQHHIFLNKWNARTMPNIPNFRLGPLDDSPCDTLGLNNLPVARWRYEEDQPGLWKTIRFTDLSFYDPKDWYWDFDDGNTSTTPSPLHTFEPGYYHVCLTVSNEYASDSVCHWIEILPTSLKEEQNQHKADLSMNPNPFEEFVEVESRSGEFRNVQMQGYDMFGHLVFNPTEITIPSKIFLPDFPPGIYLFSIQETDGAVSTFFPAQWDPKLGIHVT